MNDKTTLNSLALKNSYFFNTLPKKEKKKKKRKQISQPCLS